MNLRGLWIVRMIFGVQALMEKGFQNAWLEMRKDCSTCGILQKMVESDAIHITKSQRGRTLRRDGVAGNTPLRKGIAAGGSDYFIYYNCIRMKYSSSFRCSN